ncbi:MAG: DegV family protein [Lachnospiraceae bacterium]|nr:DegV family protein [Lachnospiraceae bacterium]
MAKVAVVTDSNSGITQDQGRALGLCVLPMPFFIKGEEYFEDINLSQEQFYEKLEGGDDIHTSQPSPEAVMKAWDSLLTEYDEIVHIPMSSGLSGSCQSARMLAEEEEYEGKVFVVNNQRISVTQRQSCLDAMELAKAGFGGAQIRDILEREKFESSIYIMLDTLYYLKKGGRITPAAAAIGTLLKIKPVLQIQGEKLDAFAKARTFSQGKSIMISSMKKDLEQRFGATPDHHTVHLAIAYTGTDEVAKQFAEEIRSEFPGYEIVINPLSLSVACHIGPGALAIACSKHIPELAK